jgi:hypothetical protein
MQGLEVNWVRWVFDAYTVQSLSGLCVREARAEAPRADSDLL